MLLGAGLRRWVGTEAEPGAGRALDGRLARPAPSAEVFINDLGPLAASVFEGAEPAPWAFGLVIGGFAAASGLRGFGVGRSVVPGFFRIAKSVFSKIASSFGG